jgi:hypothetical protein
VHVAEDARQSLHRIVQFGAYDVFGGGVSACDLRTSRGLRKEKGDELAYKPDSVLWAFVLFAALAGL